jgi:aryl-alcohol dehydrogenase-like predicted oxidoreductase
VTTLYAPGFAQQRAAAQPATYNKIFAKVIMQIRQLGASALHVTPVCLGTMTWGQQNSETEGHAQLDYAISRGVNFIDTAEMYSVPTRVETYGSTEQIIGTWLNAKGKSFREKVVVATKCAGPSRNASDVTWVRGDMPVFGKADIARGIRESLKRLQTDYIDLYQLHWPARNVPTFGAQFFDATAERESIALQETLAALNDEVKAGRVRAIGVSNETPWGMMQCLQLAQTSNLPRIACTQNAFNLLNRVCEYGLSEIGFREKVGLLAYSPLGFGYLSGKHLDGIVENSRLHLFPHFSRYNKPGVVPAVQAYAALAKENGLSLTQLALAFCKSRFFVSSTIIGATTTQQLKDNIDAFETTLTADVLAKIDVIHTRYTNPAP